MALHQGAQYHFTEDIWLVGGGEMNAIIRQCRQEIEITQEEIYSTHTTKKAGYVVERDWPRYI